MISKYMKEKSYGEKEKQIWHPITPVGNFNVVLSIADRINQKVNEDIQYLNTY